MLLLSDPPPTSFYQDSGNAAVWRELAHLKTEYSGEDKVKRQEFERIMRDFLLREDLFGCVFCHGLVDNVADSHLRDLRCTNCGFQQVTVDGE